MKMCTNHWAALRAAIDKRGLSGLVPQDGKEAVRRMADQMQSGTPSRGNFDPLMGAHNSILSNAVALVGLEIMQTNADGSDRCPLCFLNENTRLDRAEHGPAPFDAWIDRAADDMDRAAVQLGQKGQV